MSHYCVCVVIPKTWGIPRINEESIDNAVYQIIAPFEESTENPGFLEFLDHSEAAQKGYLTDKTQVVKYPDGRIVRVYDHQFYDKFSIRENVILERFAEEDGGDRETEKSRQLELISDYPIRSLYTFEQYCEDYCSYVQNPEGSWGYYCNPNATWDWYVIGGRFSGELLVKENAKGVLRLPEDEDKITAHPEGYRLVNGARMKDIAWEKMCALKEAGARAAYECLSEAFRQSDISKLGIIAKLTEDGIAGWDEMFFIKDESLEDYMDRRGATAIDKHPLDVFALVDAQGEWHSSGDMGWFGLVSNEKPAREWKNELELLTEAIDPEDFVVIIDCHI